MDKNDKNVLVVLTILIFVLVSDTMINQVSDFLAPQLITNFGVMLFVIFGIIAAISQYILLRYVKTKISYMYSKSKSTRILHRLVSLLLYVLLALVLVLIVQILTSSSYYTYILAALTCLSYLLNICLMTYFAYKFFSWYSSNRYSLIVLLYGISFSVIAVVSSLALILDLYQFGLKPAEIYPNSEVIFPSYEGTSLYFISTAYVYLDALSFTFVWGASVLLLREYVAKWRLKHWVLVCVPLIYYASTFIEYTGIYNPSTDSELISYYIYISLNSTAGGLLFGFAFLIVAQHIHNEIFKGYMIISAFGFVLLFISNQVTLVASSYPPFGAVTICFFGLSAYLILIGLYTSAISVSQDAGLRRTIRESVMKKSKLLGSIGQAEMQKEIQKWVKDLSDIHEKTNTSSTMTENDVKSYVQEVINEVSKKTID